MPPCVLLLSLLLLCICVCITCVERVAQVESFKKLLRLSDASGTLQITPVAEAPILLVLTSYCRYRVSVLIALSRNFYRDCSVANVCASLLSDAAVENRPPQPTRFEGRLHPRRRLRNVSLSLSLQLPYFHLCLSMFSFVWIGKQTSPNEKAMAMKFAQDYLQRSGRPPYLPSTLSLSFICIHIFLPSLTKSQSRALWRAARTLHSQRSWIDRACRISNHHDRLLQQFYHSFLVCARSKSNLYRQKRIQKKRVAGLQRGNCGTTRVRWCAVAIRCRRSTWASVVATNTGHHPVATKNRVTSQSLLLLRLHPTNPKKW